MHSTSPDASPTFTVVIPTFNYGRYLPAAVDSVLTQSHERWELIVVDDGSTDGTDRVLAGITDPRVRTVRQANAGPFAAVQNAFARSSTPWVVVFDADDRLAPGALARLASAAAQRPDAAALVGPWVSVREDGRRRPDPFTPPSGDSIADFRALLSGRLRFVTGAAAIARSHLHRLHGWQAPIRHGVETMVFAHLMLTGRCVAVPGDHPLLEVYDHPGRLRDSLPGLVAAGTGLVDAVFDASVVPPGAMPFRDEFLAFVQRERGRLFYRHGCYADAAASFAAAARADRRSLDARTLRRWALARLRVGAGRPGLCAAVKADAVARRRRDTAVEFAPGSSLRRFKRDPIGTMSAAAAACGDAAMLRLWRPTVLLGHPDDARHVLVTNAANYERVGLEPLWRLFGTGLINDRQPGHLPQRRMAQPFYTPAAAQASVAPALACMASVTESWENGQEVNVAQALLSANTALAGRTVLGMHDPAAAAELFQLVHRTHVKGVRIMTCPYHAVNALSLRRLRLYRRYGDRLDRRIERVIDERIAQAPATERGVFLDHLLAQRRASPGLIDRRRMIDHAKTMFAATVEPITTPTASALWRLACHPEHEERLVAEAAAFNWGSPAGVLDRLPFATAFWREALRLHPSNWLMPRRACADDTLPGGLRIRAGHGVYISQYLIHHDQRFFPDPQRFNPARFETDPPGRDTFLPFGRGPRSCIGSTVAEQVGVALLARLALDWRFEPVPGSRPEMESPNLFISQLRGTRLLLRATRRAGRVPASPPAHLAGATR